MGQCVFMHWGGIAPANHMDLEANREGLKQKKKCAKTVTSIQASSSAQLWGVLSFRVLVSFII